jgi:uncharacterized protein (DUF2249 family)/TusA-related sulfurtransferase
LVKINAHTRIKALLDQDQDLVIDRLIQLNANFSKLRNPILRNLLARRITIADACKVAHCKVEDFLISMQQIGFVVEDVITQLPIQKATVIDFERKVNIIVLDVRCYLDQNKDPLKEILNVANQLKIGDRLKILNSFEPVPLISLLTEKGFLCQIEHMDENVVVTWIEKVTASSVAVSQHSNPQYAPQQVFDSVFQSFPPEKISYLDVRELEMPQPMIQILEKLSIINEDELLYVYHKKIPVNLLPELNKRGLTFLFNHHSDHRLDILIYRL